MPRFFFHIVRNGKRIHDDEGMELHDLTNADEEATQAGREIVSASILAGGEVDRGEFQITDAVGKTLLVVPFPDIKAVK